MNEKMLAQLLRHLRLAGSLLAALDKETEGEQTPAKRRVYGMPQNITFQVCVTVEPLYPDHEGRYDPAEVLRMKPSRRGIARAVGQAVVDVTVGYKVGVRVENGDAVEVWPA